MEKKNESQSITNFYSAQIERNSATSNNSAESNDGNNLKYNHKIQMKKLFKTNQVFKVLNNASSFWENIGQK